MKINTIGTFHVIHLKRRKNLEFPKIRKQLETTVLYMIAMRC